MDTYLQTLPAQMFTCSVKEEKIARDRILQQSMYFIAKWYAAIEWGKNAGLGHAGDDVYAQPVLE